MIPIIYEEWKPLNCYDIIPNMYEISTLGNARNAITGNMLTPTLINSGYLTYTLTKVDGTRGAFLAHRLVALTFIENSNPLRITVNHDDGNKLRNYYTNLSWMTQKENNDHAIENGLNNIVGQNQYMAILTNEQVHLICRLLEQKKSYSEILSIIGLEPTDNNRDLIGNIKRGVAWTSISSQYNIDKKYKYQHHKYSGETIDKMETMLKEGYSYADIYESIYNDKYINSRQHKDYYEFIRKLSKDII